MKKSQFHKLLDLVEQIKRTDAMIRLHHSADKPDFMVSQYQAEKDTLVGCLIDELVSPSIRSAKSMYTIKLIIDRFYNDPAEDTMLKQDEDELSQLAMAL